MIRTLTIVCMSLFSLSGTAADSVVVRLSEPVSVTSEAEIFGATLNPAAKPVALQNVLDTPESFTETALRVETRVSQVCQKKGCFYIATDGQRFVRVSFKDYGFFVPTDIGGKTVTMTGVLIKRELSEEEAEHFRSDANSTDIESGTVYELVADAVSVPLG